jgi:AmmeMemoRadiSam system protein A
MKDNINKQLIELAKDSIKDELYGTNSIDKTKLLEEYPSLLEQRATFVTLNINNNLRGCIGSLVAHRSLFDDIVHNAKSSAFDDPRFAPLSKDEFENITIELSILTTPTKVEFSDIDDLKNKIKVGIDGMIIQQDGYRATFLPQVWEQLHSFEIFLNHLLQKAGIKTINSNFTVFKYQAKKII